MKSLGIEAELIDKVAYIGNDQMRMKIITPHIPWEEVRAFINAPIRVSPLQKSETADWSINLRPGIKTRTSTMGEEGRVNQAIQHHDHQAQEIYNHPKAADGQEL